ncbi:MAG: PIN domain-containing protein [bacterium]|nr:PIN domain-containing protein [bacterium]MDZ4285170.1 PIN domain-containing protein [Patescibacteria group bacterium]
MEYNRKILVDANVFIALLNKDDALHLRAVALWADMKQENRELVTLNVVASEALTVLSQRGSKALALELAETLYGDGKNDIEMVYADRMLEERALERFRSIRSKNFSFVDTIILAALERYAIPALASFDRILERYASAGTLRQV